MLYSCVVCGKTGKEKTGHQENENQVLNENGEHIAIHRLVFF